MNNAGRGRKSILTRRRARSGEAKRADRAAALPGAAARLLARLGEPQAYALPDPTQEGAVVVLQAHGAVSLGSGGFPTAAAEELVRRDLVRAAPGPSGWPVFRVTEAGAAHLRRATADSREEAFLAQHQDRVSGRVEIGGVTTPVRRHVAESPLEWLRRRKDRAGEPLIDGARFEAGERLRRDLTLGQMLPSVTLNWGATPSGAAAGAGPADATDAAIAARQRATKALDAVGADFAGLLIDLCGFLKGLERIERERGWPPRSAKVPIAMALARLADHYGLRRVARGPAASRGIRAWTAALDGGP